MRKRRAERRLSDVPLWLGQALLVISCGAKNELDSTPSSPGVEKADGSTPAMSLPNEALNATWQELGVPGAGNRPALATTPTGYYALSQRSLGDSKAPSAWESHLYRSTDGVHWQRIEASNANDNLWLRGIAYGAGRYVLAGMRFGEGDGVILQSDDGEHWQEQSVTTGAPSGLSNVVFAGSRFFALSTHRTVLTSADGGDWTPVDFSTTVMPLDVTFGSGQYVLVGSGDLQRSPDGLQWTPTPLDCALPGACMVDPSGAVQQGVHHRVVFAAGTFFIDQASSTDGQFWQSLPEQYPFAAIDGHVFGRTATQELVSWRPGEAPRALMSVRYLAALPEDERAARALWNGAVEPEEFTADHFPNDSPLPGQLEFPLPHGDDCTIAPCMVVGDRLYLVRSDT